MYNETLVYIFKMSDYFNSDDGKPSWVDDLSDSEPILYS